MFLIGVRLGIEKVAAMSAEERDRSLRIVHGLSDKKGLREAQKTKLKHEVPGAAVGATAGGVAARKFLGRGMGRHGALLGGLAGLAAGHIAGKRRVRKTQEKRYRKWKASLPKGLK